MDGQMDDRLEEAIFQGVLSEISSQSTMFWFFSACSTWGNVKGLAWMTDLAHCLELMGELSENDSIMVLRQALCIPPEQMLPSSYPAPVPVSLLNDLGSCAGASN